MPKWLLYWSDHSPLAYHRYHCTSDGIAVELTSSTSCFRPFLSSYFSSLSIFNCSFTVLFFFNHKRSLRYKKKHFSWFSGASCCLSHFLKMLLHSMTIFSVSVSLSSQTIMLFVGRFASFYTWILAPVATHGHFTSPSWISMGFLKSSSILHILPYEHEPGYIWSVVRKALRWLMAIHLTSPSAR